MIDLAVVMPVFNEEECIGEVVDSWIESLNEKSIQYKIIVINDGSQDGTQTALSIYENDPRVMLINKPNSGHGPTILQGYREGLALADWVFQCDSDNEMHAEHFDLLWSCKDNYDALFGIRANREQNPGRKVISAGSTLLVHVLFGSGVKDVNVPYRLIRSSLLSLIVDKIPPSTLAPNVIISGAVTASGACIYNCPIPHINRQTGTVSIMKWKLIKFAFKAFIQTLCCRPNVSFGTLHK